MNTALVKDTRAAVMAYRHFRVAGKAVLPNTKIRTPEYYYLLISCAVFQIEYRVVYLKRLKEMTLGIPHGSVGVLFRYLKKTGNAVCEKKNMAYQWKLSDPLMKFLIECMEIHAVEVRQTATPMSWGYERIRVSRRLKEKRKEIKQRK